MKINGAGSQKVKNSQNNQNARKHFQSKTIITLSSAEFFKESISMAHPSQRWKSAKRRFDCAKKQKQEANNVRWYKKALHMGSRFERDVIFHVNLEWIAFDHKVALGGGRRW